MCLRTKAAIRTIPPTLGAGDEERNPARCDGYRKSRGLATRSVKVITNDELNAI